MYNILKLNLARNALRYIIKTYTIREMYIPFYICDVIRQSLLKEKCKPIFYHINDVFFPENDFQENSFVLYPDYFGICNKNIEILSSRYKNLIIDNAHSFYSKPKGFACFNSARKFMPVPNGSYLWIRKTIDMKIDVEEKPYFMPQNTSDTEKNEILFQNEDIKFLHPRTVHDIETFNNNEIRLKKFLKLHEKYSGINMLKINPYEVQSPFCYPLLCKNACIADNIVKKLISRDITIYRYWNKIPKNFGEYKFYERLVPIPINT